MADKKDKKGDETQALVPSDKKVAYSLSGLARTESGQITKHNYFKFLGQDLDAYDKIELTPVQAKRLHTHLQKLSTGATAMVPMYCAGDKCPFKDRCPLQEIGKAPIGKQCLIEVRLLKEFIVRYFDEFDVDPSNWTEVGYVNELAEIMIMEMRLNMSLSRHENSELVIDQVAQIGQDGTPVIQKQLSPYMEQKEKLASRRSRIIKLMVGDRQEKYKKEAALKVKLDADPSSRMANMRSKLENLQRQLDNLSSEIPEGGSTEGIVTPEDIIDADEE